MSTKLVGSFPSIPSSESRVSRSFRFEVVKGRSSRILAVAADLRRGET
jgi:hypothetical protein